MASKELRALIVLAGKIDPSLQSAMLRASGESAKLARNTEKSARGLNKVTNSVRSTVAGPVAQLAGLLATVLGVQKIIDTADAWTTVRSRIGLVNDSMQQQQESLEAVFSIAQKTKQSFEATGDLYTKIAMNAEQLKLANNDILQITDTVNKALRIGGGTTQQNEAAIMQFSQALASGRLQGDELRSLLENAPRLTKAIAEGLGVATGDLKKFGSEGVLTADVIIAALQNQTGVINEEFSKMPVTIRGAFTYFNNAFGKFVDDTGKKTNVFNRISAGIVRGTDLLFNSLGKVGESTAFQSMVEYVRPFIPILSRAGEILVDIGRTVGHTLGPVFSLLFQKLQPIGLQIDAAILPLLVKLSDTLKAISPIIQVVGKILVHYLAGAFNAVWPIIKNVFGILGGLLDFITGVFTGNWSKAWEGVKAIFGNIFGGIGNLLLLPLKLMITNINSVIQGINGVKVPDWVPLLGGKTLGIPLLPIPKFALGGIATQASIFGEAGPEMAIPLRRTQRSFDLLGMANRILGYRSGGGNVIHLNINVDARGNPDADGIAGRIKEVVRDVLEEITGEEVRVSFG